MTKENREVNQAVKKAIIEAVSLETLDAINQAFDASDTARGEAQQALYVHIQSLDVDGDRRTVSKQGKDEKHPLYHAIQKAMVDAGLMNKAYATACGTFILKNQVSDEAWSASFEDGISKIVAHAETFISSLSWSDFIAQRGVAIIASGKETKRINNLKTDKVATVKEDTNQSIIITSMRDRLLKAVEDFKSEAIDIDAFVATVQTVANGNDINTFTVPH